MSCRRSIAALAAVGIVGALTTGADGYTSYTSARWPSASATFYVNTGSVTDVSPSAAVTAIQVAMNAWNTQSGSAIRLSYGGTTSKNQLVNDGVNAMFFRQESGGGAIAANYTWWSGSQLVDSDVVFYDLDRTFYTGTSDCVSGAYIEDVAAHELGHGIGLDHSGDGDATMYPSYGSCSQGMRTLAADDIAGAQALYPGGSPQISNTAPSVTISSPANGASYGEGVLVSFDGSVWDTQDGNLTPMLQWTDNGNAIGSGGSFSSVLTVGSHTIVAYANDSGGRQGSKSISVNVGAISSGGTTSGSTGPGSKSRGKKPR